MAIEPNQETAVRDELARERTRLAVERTFLAYVRTSLALLAGGAALGEFFPPSLWRRVAVGLLFAGGLLTLAFGVYRVSRVMKRLNDQ